MVDQIQKFISVLEERSHILKLVENVDGIAVKLVCEDDNRFISFIRGEVLCQDDPERLEVLCEIRGPSESMKQLISGKEKLRNLVTNGCLSVSGPFRMILLIESIFYLTKSLEPIPFNMGGMLK